MIHLDRLFFDMRSPQGKVETSKLERCEVHLDECEKESNTSTTDCQYAITTNLMAIQTKTVWPYIGVRRGLCQPPDLFGTSS